MARRDGKPRLGLPTAALSKNVVVHLLLEANNQFFSNPQRRRTQVAGGTQEQFGQRLFVRFVLFHVQPDDLLSLGDEQHIRLTCQR